MSQIDVVVDGQFGSCGKGHLAAWLAAGYGDSRPSMAVRVAGPNAGHSVIGPRGTDTSNTCAPNLCDLVGQTTTDAVIPAMGDRFAWRLRQVPTAAVSNPHTILVIAAGSEIDPPILLNEVACLDAAGYDVSSRLLIDSTVTVISNEHKYDEKYGRGTWGRDAVVAADGSDGIATLIGSTGKGIGAARADRLWREPGVMLANDQFTQDQLFNAGIEVRDTIEVLGGFLRSGDGSVLVEGTQGYGLGLHARDGQGRPFYPYGTSSDCRAIDFLAMAGISPWATDVDGQQPTLTTWVCVRPYPIRVGGNSGPMASETSWEALGLEPELTTVTLKTRRVAQWDGALVRRALAANGGPGPNVRVALMMFDQAVPAVAGARSAFDVDHSLLVGKVMDQVRYYESELGCEVSVLGTGPDTILDLDHSAVMDAAEVR